MSPEAGQEKVRTPTCKYFISEFNNTFNLKLSYFKSCPTDVKC